MYTAQEIAIAFNTANTRKSWHARPNARDAQEVVHFINANNLVTLVYDVRADRYEVRFNKFQASWGDYIKSIARSLHTILNTLKQAGLIAHAPEGYEGIEIIATASNDNTVYVRWPDPNPPIIQAIDLDQLPLQLGPFQLKNIAEPLDTSDTEPIVENLDTEISSTDGETE